MRRKTATKQSLRPKASKRAFRVTVHRRKVPEKYASLRLEPGTTVTVSDGDISISIHNAGPNTVYVGGKI